MSTLKINILDTPSGSGNITVNRPMTLTAGDIVTADLANDAVTLAKMAGGTDGQVITYDASGDPVAVGPGTSGQVLTSAGAGAPPTFTAAGGKILQVVNVLDGVMATTTSTTPVHDDTKPLISEGTEFLTLAVTGASTSNKFYVECKIWLGHTVANRNIVTALFNTDVHSTEALSTCGIQNHTATAFNVFPFIWYGAVPTTSATTFRIRAGSQGSGTTTYTGQDSQRKHGGAALSSITIWEISA